GTYRHRRHRNRLWRDDDDATCACELAHATLRFPGDAGLGGVAGPGDLFAAGAQPGCGAGALRRGGAPARSGPPDVRSTAAGPAIADRTALPLQFASARAAPVPNGPGRGTRNVVAPVAL